MGVVFGLSGLLGFLAPVGIREVLEAGSVTQALAERRTARRGGEARAPRQLRLVAGRPVGAHC